MLEWVLLIHPFQISVKPCLQKRAFFDKRQVSIGILVHLGRTMKNLIFGIFLIFLMSVFTRSAWANIEFDIHILETTEKTKSPHEYDMSVELGDHYFSF